MKVCYLGLYNGEAIRDRNFLSNLTSLGVEITYCVDTESRGLIKFFRIFKKLLSKRNECDLVWVGYSSGSLAPIAKLLSHKKVIYNALNSLYESVILDQERYGKFSISAAKIWLTDFLAFHTADAVLVETEEQKKFLAKNFFVSKEKIFTVYTGADEKVFYPEPDIEKPNRFTVIFRGSLANATGADYVLFAAKILRDRGEDVNFVMIGRGQRQNDIKKIIDENKLTNVKLFMDFISPDELRTKILECHVMLGQFSQHDRMDRTIQYKTFEALALGMPYVTRDSKSNREILTDHVNCLFVKPGSASDLADKILELKKDFSLREKISKNARDLFVSRFSRVVIAGKIYDILKKFF